MEKYNSVLEAMFKQSAYSVRPELLSDWLEVLQAENQMRINESCVEEGYFKTGVLSELVFSFCKHHSQSTEVRYLAMELLDRFCIKHIQDLHKQVSGTGSAEECFKLWKEVIPRIKSQLSLRALTCCQLASKLVSSYSNQIISSGKVYNSMKLLGHSYNLKAIPDSELRVLKTVDYRLPCSSPLLYVETLLAVLEINWLKKLLTSVFKCISKLEKSVTKGNVEVNFEPETYHPTCCQLLDLVYMRRNEFCSRYIHIVISRSTPQESNKMNLERVKLSNDYMLLGSSVITAAVYIVSNEKLSCQVATSLHAAVNKSSDDILDFAAVLIEHLQPQ